MRPGFPTSFLRAENRKYSEILRYAQDDNAVVFGE
jgi:hypothetical protein